jgi:hypothetical protein
VDPGWKGNLTLELSNVATLPIALYLGMRIGQISFFAMSSAVERPYGSKELGSKYQGQSTPTASASFRDLDDARRMTRGGPRTTDAAGVAPGGPVRVGSGGAASGGSGGAASGGSGGAASGGSGGAASAKAGSTDRR